MPSWNSSSTSPYFSSSSCVRSAIDRRYVYLLDTPCEFQRRVKGFEMDIHSSNYAIRCVQRDYSLVCCTWLFPIRWMVGRTSDSEYSSGWHVIVLADAWCSSLVETNKTFREIVISLAATYGLYFVGSLLHFEPWHMFTCFLQYLFLLPSCEFDPMLIRPWILTHCTV